MLIHGKNKDGKVMIIKNHTFGREKPVICMPVVERTTEEILAAIRAMTAQKVDMIEWRMDWYEEVSDIDAVKELLEKAAVSLRETVFLCTFRSKRQGGEREITQEEYLALNQAVAETGVPDLIDLEFFEADDPGKAIETIRQTGAGVVCSHHNFQKTPDVDTMKQQLVEMVEAGADFAKLAVMPVQKTDVLRLMEAVLGAKEAYPKSHLIAMSMGKDGVVSRLLGGWYQSEVTFAAFEKSSAPGQVSYRTAQETLEKIEECMKES